MNRLRGAFATHCRNIDVFYHHTKTVFTIPLYRDSIGKPKVEFENGSMIVTLDLQQASHHPAKSSSYNPLVETERPVGTDNSSQSHQLS